MGPRRSAGPAGRCDSAGSTPRAKSAAVPAGPQRVRRGIPGSADSRQRLALVIGNGDYRNADPPTNQPTKHARALAGELRLRGFDGLGEIFSERDARSRRPPAAWSCPPPAWARLSTNRPASTACSSPNCSRRCAHRPPPRKRFSATRASACRARPSPSRCRGSHRRWPRIFRSRRRRAPAGDLHVTSNHVAMPASSPCTARASISHFPGLSATKAIRAICCATISVSSQNGFQPSSRLSSRRT